MKTKERFPLSKEISPPQLTLLRGFWMMSKFRKVHLRGSKFATIPGRGCPRTILKVNLLALIIGTVYYSFWTMASNIRFFKKAERLYVCSVVIEDWRKSWISAPYLHNLAETPEMLTFYRNLHRIQTVRLAGFKTTNKNICSWWLKSMSSLLCVCAQEDPDV